MNPLILETAARYLLPLLLLFSIFLLWCGHHEPGGGFAGGLIAAGGIGLTALARDPAAARRVLRVEPDDLVATGLLVALVAGLAGPLAGRPFLTGVWVALPLPDGRSLDLGTPLLFDLGVYLVVVGIASGIMLTFAEEP